MSAIFLRIIVAAVAAIEPPLEYGDAAHACSSWVPAAHSSGSVSQLKDLSIFQLTATLSRGQVVDPLGSIALSTAQQSAQASLTPPLSYCYHTSRTTQLQGH
jgi:hypothetical protein